MIGKIIKRVLLIILLVLVITAPASAELKPGEKFKAEVVKVLGGGSFVFAVDLITYKVRFTCRMLGYSVEPGSAEARERLIAFLGDGSVTIRAAEYTDPRGAWLCDVWSSNGAHVNKTMQRWLDKTGETKI